MYAGKQFHIESKGKCLQGNYDKALKYFEKAPDSDMQSKYQLGVIYFDALGLQKPDYVSKIVDNFDLAEFTSVYASL